MFSVGALIWISLRPLLRLAIGVACGFFITKADMFPPVAARGASQIILNVTTPCLLFSKIIPAFNTDNIRLFGPLFLVAALYEILGVVIAFIIKQFFWVPHRFRYGLLVAGGFGNVGDIPISVIMSVTGTAPFKGLEDQNLSVAYISVFLLVFIVTLFPMGAHNWIKMDFVGPDVEPCDVQEAIRVKRRKLLCMSAVPSRDDSEKGVQQLQVQEKVVHASGEDNVDPCTPRLRKLNTVHDDSETEIAEETVVDIHSPRGSISGATPRAFKLEKDSSDAKEDPTRLQVFFQSLLTAPSIAIFVSFPIALVPQLKALFIVVPSVNMPSAPDGQPPLSFIMDTIPQNQWKSLPLGAISSLAIGKLVLMPVFGVLIVQGLVRCGLIPKEDKVLQFVCIFTSCLPTATTQVYLTQAYSAEGDAQHLSAFLIPQYILMFISMTALTAYALNLIF
ncbi:auxin efflux carrier transmembrane protein [Ephemerocybe angulata]|uniref:Auxin efflux carrier transmembrane protein n=1 Tax=Ephemerocybe angulata TaxID=980116 RepID=A0A8H6M2I8_9AGAR|nr:auxin efflux carrier transmembrane protein [Tulosesus angulatus]